MSIVDERGRVLGRVNLVDATALLIVAILIPAAYLAYLLFRAPQARLLKVEPSSIIQGTNVRLLLWGENLRPFMRVSMNDVQARDFMIGSTKGAEANLPELEPGTYDVVLHDSAQELTRLPKAVTVVPATPTPSMTLEAAGAFVGLDADGAAQVKVGLKLPEGNGAEAEVVAVGAVKPALMRLPVGDSMLTSPVKDALLLPATLRLRCFTEQNPDGTLRCTVPGVPQAVTLMPDAYLTFRTQARWFAFQIYDVHADAAPPTATARVRFLTSREIAARVKAGDLDTSLPGYADENRPRLTAIAAQRPAPATGAAASFGASPGFLGATVRVPLQRSPRGWLYRGQRLKAGVSLAFETGTYLITGTVIDLTLAADAQQ